MTDKPTIVGVTGGIGSGKSTICKIFEVLGCKVYYSDDRAKWLMESNASVVKAVVELFGEEAYIENKLNRKWIGERAFKDSSLLERLNGLIHPEVKHDFESWIEKNQDNKPLIKESALLFENGSYKELDCCILVVADEQARIERVVARDAHRTEEGVKAIISKQMSDDDKMSLADFVITNNGDSSVIKQVLAIYKQLN